MRILLLLEYSFPCDHSYLHDVCATIMPRRGHAVFFLMWGPRRGVHSWGGATVVTMGPAVRSRRLGALSNYINLVRMYRAACRIVRTQRIDVVQSRADWTTARAACTLARRFGIRFVYQANYPAEAERLLVRRRGLSGRVRRLDVAFHRHNFTSIYRTASAILPISQSFSRYFRFIGVPGEKLHPFPMGVSREVLDRSVSAEERSRIRDAFGFDRLSTVVGYLGTLHAQRDPGFLAELFSALATLDEDVYVLVIGAEDRGVALSESRHCGSARGGRIRTTGWVSRAEALRLLGAVDIGLSIIPPTGIYRISSPTKVVEMMASRIPVVVNREVFDQATLVRRSGGGIVCRYEQPAVLRAVLELIRAPAVRDVMGRAGHAYVRKYRCYETMFEAAEKLYGPEATPDRPLESR